MASPSAVFTEMVATTLRNHGSDVTDNVSNHNGLLRVMKDKGHVKTESGGTEIAEPISIAENQTYYRYSGWDTLDIRASEVLSAVKFDWQQIAIHVTASGRELRMNNGPQAMVKLSKARMQNAKATAANQMSVDLYSDGSLPNQIGGLASIVTNNGQGTVGGINSANLPVWQNQFREMAGTNTWSSATILSDMNALWLKCVSGTDKPDLIVLTHDFYSAYEGSLQQNQRYTDPKMASAGFETLKYKTASVLYDDNANFGTTSEQGYFLNTDFLYLVQHSDAQWTQDDDKKPLNQDGVVIPLYWMGNLICTNRRRQGKLIDAA